LKPKAFSYVKPSSLNEALSVLSAHADDASILAGGQSLVPTLNFRLSEPSLLIDINGLVELGGITEDGDVVRLGALCRYREIETSDLIAQHVPLLRLAVPHIAHPAIRNRGTIGGSVANADPASEMPACLCALDATMIIASAGDTRKVRARDFFKALYETALDPNEMLIAVDVPKIPAGYRSAFDEFARRRGDYALCGAAAHAKVEGARISDLKLVYFSVGGTPVIAANAMAAIEGRAIDEATIASAQDALTEDLDPFSDQHCSAKLRKHYARELAARLLKQLISAEGAG